MDTLHAPRQWESLRHAENAPELVQRMKSRDHVLGLYLPGIEVSEVGCWPVVMLPRWRGGGGNPKWIEHPQRSYPFSRGNKLWWLAYEQFIGPVPEGHELDHECHNVACVNPTHLRPVTKTQHAARNAVWIAYQRYTQRCGARPNKAKEDYDDRVFDYITQI